MRLVPIFAVLSLISGASGPVHAQTTVRITEADCSRLVNHVAAADVNYRPGVDVNGNAVAPADLNTQPQIRMPDVISIPVTIDLATNLGIDTPFLARPTVGDTVNVASRLEESTRTVGCRLIVSDDLMRRVQESRPDDLAALGEGITAYAGLALRGREGTIDVWILGEGDKSVE
jgi:hypothetical protein